MKKGYEKPMVEILDFKLEDAIMDDAGITDPTTPSFGVDDEIIDI